MKRIQAPGFLSAALIAVFLLNVYPIFWLVLGSVRGPDGRFTWSHYAEIFGALTHQDTMANTVLLAAYSIPAAIVMGSLAALATTRVRTPLGGWIRAASTVAFVSPPWVTAMAYALMFAPNSGIVNRWFFAAFGVRPFNAFSMEIMAFVTALFLYPYVYITVTAALDNMESSYEEAALMVGCSPLATLFRVTLPLVLPAIVTSTLFSVVYVWGLYSIPAVLGVPGKVYVFPTYLWLLLNSMPPRIELSSAMAVLFSVLSLGFFWGAMRLARGYGGRFQVVAGKGHKSVQLRVGGGWSMALGAFNWLVVAATLLVPYLVLLAISTSNNPYRPPGAGNFTFKHYVIGVTTRGFPQVVSNTLLIGLYVAVLAGLLALVIAYLHRRSPGRLTETLAAGALFPIVIPGVAFVVGTAWAWMRPPVVLYGTLWIIAINQIARYLPLGLMNMRDGLGQLDPTLEEAAAVCGANNVQRVRRIAMPLLRPAVSGALLLLFMSSLKDLLSPSFLGDGSPKTATLATRIFFLWDEGLVAQSAALCIVLAIITFVLYFPLAGLLSRRRAAAGPGA